ncbi:MAG: DUF6452 family protein [Capnocytophaga sp.]|nr:DUF6452 family protein [Capnocytophaga sp.]
MKYKITSFLFAIALIALAFYACEPDDLCENTVVTPRLVVRTYSAASPTTVSPVNNLLVYGEGSSLVLSYTSLDSLALPLKIDANSTTYVMVKNAVYNTSTGELASGSAATVTFTYDVENEFVSKGCGFKAVFKNLDAAVEDPANSWITNINILNSTVENESNAKVHIYH